MYSRIIESTYYFLVVLTTVVLRVNLRTVLKEDSHHVPLALPRPQVQRSLTCKHNTPKPLHLTQIVSMLFHTWSQISSSCVITAKGYYSIDGNGWIFKLCFYSIVLYVLLEYINNILYK